MKKIIQNGVIYPIIGLFFVIILYAVVGKPLVECGVIGIISFLLIIPVVVLFISMLVHGIMNVEKSKSIYLIAILAAIFMIIIVSVFTKTFITPEVMRSLEESAESSNLSISFEVDNTSSTIQSAIFYIAISGIGAFVGNRVSSKKSKNTITQTEHYD